MTVKYLRIMSSKVIELDTEKSRCVELRAGHDCTAINKNCTDARNPRISVLDARARSVAEWRIVLGKQLKGSSFPDTSIAIRAGSRGSSGAEREGIRKGCQIRGVVAG